MSEWIEWSGGECPVPIGTLVDVQYRAHGFNYHVRAGLSPCYTGSNPKKCAADWRNLGRIGDIIAYRIINDGEDAKREARSELFKKMIEGVAPVGGEPKLPAPKKKVKVSG